MSARHTDRHSQGHDGNAGLVLGGLILLIVAIVAVDVAVQLGAKLGHWHHRPPTAPNMLLERLADGRTHWPVQATPVLAAELAAILVLVALFALVRARTRRDRRASDRAAVMMRVTDRTSPLTQRGAQAAADRFGVKTPGLLIARSIAGNQPLYMPWNWMAVDIWGPQRGKTTSRAIPTMLAAPAAAFATSNKPDLYAACAGPRSGESRRIWNFDPQRICGDVDPDWWWNPLTYVTSERRAAELTTAFVDAYRSADARTDAYFDKAGQSLIAGLLQAAALDKRPITDAYVWSTREEDDEAAVILEEHGLALAAASMRSVLDAPHEQRGGVYGTASELLSFLRDPDISRWVTDPEGRRPQLNLAEFVASHDTLFLHSKEGPGSSSGLVTAMTMALCDAAEQLASRSPRGRLPRPLVGVLDEAANICRWRQLPDLYSHYGSRGIILSTILQSWSQGCQTWTEPGMKKLWGASNVRVYGGGASEREFLADLETQIGEYNRRVRSVSSSSGRGGSSKSISEQLTPTPILTVAELAALEGDRIIVIPSGARPILARPIPWWQTEHRAAIDASIEAHDPAARTASPEPAAAAAPVPNPYLEL
jgi:type IV secretory pathway TraG/TraD family ATPase VirD4